MSINWNGLTDALKGKFFEDADTEKIHKVEGFASGDSDNGYEMRVLASLAESEGPKGIAALQIDIDNVAFFDTIEDVKTAIKLAEGV